MDRLLVQASSTRWVTLEKRCFTASSSVYLVQPSAFESAGKFISGDEVSVGLLSALDISSTVRPCEFVGTTQVAGETWTFS
ncbi:unnamed protein product [Nezara viridula]|uniref:Uncharacterized protein n=1 Tax=Nezara viridula TaxID=85310 RepID=A0A9P0E2T3_NEZVI|nr:unnamed protein product [Nezara viridula]